MTWEFYGKHIAVLYLVYPVVTCHGQVLVPSRRWSSQTLQWPGCAVKGAPCWQLANSLVLLFQLGLPSTGFSMYFAKLKTKEGLLDQAYLRILFWGNPVHELWLIAICQPHRVSDWSARKKVIWTTTFSESSDPRIWTLSFELSSDKCLLALRRPEMAEPQACDCYSYLWSSPRGLSTLLNI